VRTFYPEADDTLCADVAERRAALREVWASRCAFKAFAARVGAPALLAHGLDAVAAHVAELERCCTLPVELFVDSAALKKRAYAGGCAQPAGTVEGRSLVVCYTPPPGAPLRLRVLHVRISTGACIMQAVGGAEVRGMEMFAFALPFELKGEVVAAHLLAARGA
jgi:hypothetical protein